MKTLLHIGITLAAALFVASCTREPETRGGGNNGGDDSRSVTLSVIVPGASTFGPSTRSIGSTQENTVQTVDVLAFKIDGSNETFDYATTATLASGAGAATQTFTASLQVKSYQQRIVLITNAASQVAALAKTVGTAKATLLSGLKYNITTDGWNAASASNYTALPMWGESSPETITQSTTALSSQVNLLRMVARIDVLVGSSANSSYKLKSVALYNTNTGGNIVPDASKVQSSTVSGSTYLKVTAPTIPSELQPNSARKKGPINYTDFSSPGTADVSMIGAIYTFETAAQTTDPTATCIVVGGLYGSDTAVSYHKIEFLAAGTQTRLDILRNYQYSVQITGVQGRGYPTADEAFNAKGTNITAQTLVWSQQGMDNIVFDGKYALATDKYQVTLSANQYTNAVSTGDNVVKVWTDYPSGWTIASITDTVTGAAVTWLKPTPTSGGASTTASMTLAADANTTGQNRWATITLKAGRMTLLVLVSQTNSPAISLKISQNSVETQEIVFSAAGGVAPTAQSFTVDWLPATNPVSVSPVVQVAQYEFPNPGGNPAVADGAPFLNMSWPEKTGTKIFTVSPPALTASELAANPFIAKASRFDMTINNGFTTITKSITLRQLYYQLFVEAPSWGANPFASPYYALLGGGTWNYNVRSNSNWTIKSITTVYSRTGDALMSNKSTDNVNVGANGIANTTPGGGYTETFTTNNTRRGNWGWVDVTYGSNPSGRFNDVTKRIFFPSAQFSIYSICLTTSSSNHPRDYGFWSGNSDAPGSPYTNRDVQTMTQTAANYGTNLASDNTASSKVFTAPIYINGTWAYGGTTTITVDQINAASNYDMLVISGNSKIPRTSTTNGSDVAQAIWTNFLAKNKPVLLCIDDTDSILSMFLNLRSNGAIDSSYNMLSAGNLNGSAPTYKYNQPGDDISNGQFGYLQNLCWGADGTSTATYWMTDSSGKVNNSPAFVYSNGVNQGGDTTGISAGTAGTTASNGMSSFRFLNTPLIVCSDDGFLVSTDQSSATGSPTKVDTSSKAPVGKENYGGASTKQSVYNSFFIANTVAWAIMRRTTQ